MSEAEVDPLWVPSYATKREHVVLWQEDECAPDAERLDDAWLRIFGEPRGEPAERFDGGDALYSLHVGNRVACVSYPGNSAIYQWMPARKFA